MTEGPEVNISSQEEHEQHLEIERKFLVIKPPKNLEQYSSEKIVQGYLAIVPDGTEVRLRQDDDHCYLTVKSGGGKIRQELNVTITKEQFEGLWTATRDRVLEKVRYKIPYQGYLIELDIYAGKLAGHITAEVEFKDHKSCDDFIPPEWFDQEVTEDKRYKNQSLASVGL